MADIVSVAQSQVGVSEIGSTNQVKYNDWYYGHHVYGDDYPWCAVFVSWCAHQAGIPETVVPKTCSTSELRQFYEKRGLFHRKNSGYRPVAGDIMILDGHTGIVYASDANKYYTVEGNSSNKVQRVTRTYNAAKLIGWGHPAYGASIPVQPDSGTAGYAGDNTGYGTASGADLGVGTFDYTKYIVKSGDTLQSIARQFNVTTALIQFINNLETDQIAVGQSLNLPTPKDVYTPEEASKGAGNVTVRHSVSVDVYHPVVKADFYGEYGQIAAVSNGVTQGKDADNDIISVNTVRNMGQDCPTFTITLVWRGQWYSKLASNDLVLIRMQRPPESMETTFVGLIDDIRKTMDWSSGQPQRAIQVTGRGFNKAFVNFDVGLLKNIAIDMGTGFFGDLMQMTQCNSYDAIRLAWSAYVGKGINYSFGNGKKFGDYFQYKGNTRDGESLVDFTSFTTYSGSLWNFLKELGNAPFCETFWDIQDDRPTLVHRRTPFNRDDWTALPLIVISDHDLVSDNTGRSDLETYTVFSVQQQFMGDDYTNIYRPLWYPPHYSKYGITQLQVSTIYDVAGGADIQSTMAQYFKDLFNWNIKNSVFSNGTLVVKGKAAYHVGQRINIEYENMEYYVESVTHNFNVYGNWTTSLGVTRGITPNERFTAPWGLYEEMTDRVMTAIVQQTTGEDIDWANLPEVTYTNNSTGVTPSAVNPDGTAVYSSQGSVSGNTIFLPSGLGSVYTYMGWQCITAKSSDQYKLRAQAGMNFDKDGIGIINGRYVVACTTTFGKIGDYLTVRLSNGQSFNCIVGDTKRQTDAGACKWGHMKGKSVIEFIVNKSTWYGTNRTVLKAHPEWKKSTTVSVTNTGNYWG